MRWLRRRFAALTERLSRYATVGVVCAIAHNAVMIGCDLLGVHYLPATLVSVATVTPLGYALHCRFTFRREQSPRSFMRFAGGILAGYPFSLALMALFCSGFGWSAAVAAPLGTAILFLFNYGWAHWALKPRPTQMKSVSP